MAKVMIDEIDRRRQLDKYRGKTRKRRDGYVQHHVTLLSTHGRTREVKVGDRSDLWIGRS